jgi:hypothetical protein
MQRGSAFGRRVGREWQMRMPAREERTISRAPASPACFTQAALISRIFSSLGRRERGPGAGRKPSPEALALLAHAEEHYGDRALRVLYAACRAGKAQSATQRSGVESRKTTSDLIVLAQLDLPRDRTHQPAAKASKRGSRF